MLLFSIITKKTIWKNIRKAIPFTIIPKLIKYLGINLPKEVKHLYMKKLWNSDERN